MCTFQEEGTYFSGVLSSAHEVGHLLSVPNPISKYFAKFSYRCRFSTQCIRMTPTGFFFFQLRYLVVKKNSIHSTYLFTYFCFFNLFSLMKKDIKSTFLVKIISVENIFFEVCQDIGQMKNGQGCY